MSEHWTDRLSEYLDGELDAVETARLEAHLAACDECRTTLTELRRVVNEAARLEDVPPENDLWPAILERIRAGDAEMLPFPAAPAPPRRGFHFSVPQLAAAATVLVSLGAGAVWLMTRPAAEPAPTVAETEAAPPPAQQAMATQLVASTQAPYEEAIRQLERELDRRRPNLDSATIAVVERNLRIIDAAIAEARAALQNDPSNVWLYQHLDNTTMRKIDLLRRAASMRSAGT